MMDKEEYEKELVRMWDSLRSDEYKGKNICDGIFCEDCPLSEINNGGGCMEPMKVFEIIKIVEKWSKEHPPKKLTRFEFEMLKWLDKAGYKFIARGPLNNLDAFDSTPEKFKVNGFNGWVSETEYKDLTEFNELFQFIKWADEEPTSIKQVLKNCEVKEDV